MMKAVLLSIRPKWCELIASGRKTVEVRKTRPKIPVPFKCYIYRTNGGKVIGEFVCDEVIPVVGVGFTGQKGIEYCLRRSDWSVKEFDYAAACFSPETLKQYLTGKGSGYSWHISDLKIYDKPKELGNFWKADKCPYATESGCTYKYHCFRAGQTQRCGETLTRPPQSWCYVEEL